MEPQKPAHAHVTALTASRHPLTSCNYAFFLACAMYLGGSYHPLPKLQHPSTETTNGQGIYLQSIIWWGARRIRYATKKTWLTRGACPSTRTRLLYNENLPLMHVTNKRMSSSPEAAWGKRWTQFLLVAIPDGERMRVLYYSMKVSLRCLGSIAFFQYLEGTNFVTPPEHHALKWILNLADSTNQLVQWHLPLLGIEFDVVPCAEITHQADNELSPLCITEEECTTIDD